ncbi:MAG TPA: M12 family metallo-peptidase, partial [Chitinophagaceae bacterium]
TAYTGEPVEIYFECDYKFYLDKASNTTTVINYVLSFFNNTALLYDNENIKVQVSQILVWTTQDPEAAAGLNTTGTVLPAFRDRMTNTTYIGDYAHFLSTRSLGGGIAYLLSNPCNTTKGFKSAVSAINNSYSNFPTYSWTVQVVTHEMGHNLGSNHTQWCGWAGGAIDNCYTTEGGCAPGPAPVGGGTIMSYCHLTGAGINFNNGFGPQPGDRIRSVVGAAACFGNCRMTIAINKTDASCGQNNGEAAITVTSNTGTVNYTWSNGQTGSVLTNAAPGTYHVTVNDAAGCQVMGVVNIVNLGANLNVTLTPNVPTGFCSGNNVVLTATNNAAYTYQWSKNSVPIGGATSNTYTATSTGNYSVTVTSGACVVNRSVQVTEVTPPATVISPAGPLTFCETDNTQLNADAGPGYSYQWYRNGNPITGAINPTYNVTSTGNYSVKIGAVGCERTSAATQVTINPSPLATVVATGATSFCNGGSAALNTTTGTGYSYQWYNNSSPINGAVNSSYTATTAGNYTVVTTLGTCSRTSNGTSIIVWTNPTVTVNPTVSTIQKYHTQVLTGAGANSYNWTAQPAYVSATTTAVTVMPLTTTSFVIQGTDNNGCKGTATALINVIGCGDVTGISATPYSPSRVMIKWTNPPGATTDTLQYRKAGSTTWTRIFVAGQEYELNGLDPNTDYEYNIIPLCNTTTVYLPSETKNFKTAALDNGLYIRLYPNPLSNSGQLEVIVDQPFTLQAIVVDGYGRKVININPKESFAAGQVIKPVNVGVLSSGVYYVIANINGKNHNLKMLVVH